MSHVRRKRSNKPVRRVEKKEYKRIGLAIFILVLIITSILLGIAFINF